MHYLLIVTLACLALAEDCPPDHKWSDDEICYCDQYGCDWIDPSWIDGSDEPSSSGSADYESEIVVVDADDIIRRALDDNCIETDILTDDEGEWECFCYEDGCFWEQPVRRALETEEIFLSDDDAMYLMDDGCYDGEWNDFGEMCICDEGCYWTYAAEGRRDLKKYHTEDDLFGGDCIDGTVDDEGAECYCDGSGYCTWEHFD